MTPVNNNLDNQGSITSNNPANPNNPLDERVQEAAENLRAQPSVTITLNGEKQRLNCRGANSSLRVILESDESPLSSPDSSNSDESLSTSSDSSSSDESQRLQSKVTSGPSIKVTPDRN